MARPMTLTEKILAAHAVKADVAPGDIISIDLDLVMANELSAAVAITEFHKIKGASKVLDSHKIALCPSQDAPMVEKLTA